MLKQLFFIIIVIAIANQSQSQTSSHYLIVYPNTAEAVPMNDSTLSTGDSIVNHLISEFDVYRIESLKIGAKYWPHAVMPHHVYLNGNADTLRERFLSTGHFDSII